MSDWRKRNARALLRDFQKHGLALDTRLLNYAGENLRGEVFAPKENLAGADFRGADLTGARLAEVILTNANLSNARLAGANLISAKLTGADLTGADLTGASLIGADLRDCTLAGTTWHRAKLTAAQTTAPSATTGWGTALPDPRPRLQIQPGASAYWEVAWHPLQNQIAVASGNYPQLLDPATGTLLHTLTGHTNRVRALAYSPDGTQLTTASDDSTARIWDPATG
ncbi:pentapeptide repeat-containing protein, partial [Sphaerisporangium aureirubrum]